MATSDDILNELKKVVEALKASAKATTDAAEAGEARRSAADAKEIERASKELSDQIEILGDLEEGTVEYNKQLEITIQALIRKKQVLGETTVEFQRLLKQTQAQSKLLQGFDNALKNNIKTLTGVTDASDTLIGSFFKLSNETGSTKEAFDQAQKTIGDSLNTLDVGVSIVRKSVEMSALLAAQINKETAAFNAATGAGGVYNAQLREGEKENRELGISVAELGASFTSLMDGLSGFGTMQAEEQVRLTELTAQYAKLGVSTADFTGILETSTRMLGMSTAQTEAAIEDTRLLAQGIGISLPKALNDLNSALPKLVNFGDNAIEIFQELEKQAQATGLSVDELIGISEGFMTFDDASKAAGNLNAVLGTQMFDTMALLEAQLQGPDAFGNLLRDQLQGAIGDFDSLNTFQKDAIANAAGLNREQLSAIMNAGAAVEEQSELQTNFNDALATGRSLFEELAILGKQLVINLSPALELLQKVFGFINGVLGKFPDFLKGALAIIGGAKLALGSAKKMLGLGPPVKVMVMNPGFGGPGGGPGGPGGPAPGGAGGRFSGFSKAGFGIGAAGLGAGMLADHMGAPEKVGGFLSGAGTGAMMGSMFGPGGAVVGGLIGGIAGLFADGTDDYPGGPLLNVAGEAGEELIVPPPGSAIINNENTEKLAKMGGGGDQAVVAAINNLSTKMDSLMQRLGAPGDFVLEVNKREFARLTNEHFGAPGSSPISGVG